MKYQGCYATFSEDVLKIGNYHVEQCITIVDGIPFNTYVLNKKSGYQWGGDGSVPVIQIPQLNLQGSEVSVDMFVDEFKGLCARLRFEKGQWTVTLLLRVFPDNACIMVKTYVTGALEPQESCIYGLGIEGVHLKTRTVELLDVTDENNTLVKEDDDLVYRRRPCTLRGQMFAISDYARNETLLLVKEAPSMAGRLDNVEADVRIEAGSSASVWTTVQGGYDPYYVTIGVGRLNTVFDEYKDYYQQFCKIPSLYIMSNTWGDRSQDRAVNEDFILKELELAADLGLDIVQIDDGWQQGITMNSALAKGGAQLGYGLYQADPNFWKINTAKFPNGLEPITLRAQELGVKLGLWFSPDLYNQYENMEKDVETILRYWKEYHIEYFKLDGLTIHDLRTQKRLLELVTTVLEKSHDQIHLNMDMTAGKRWGLLYKKEYGRIFLENRYTDWGNYYPHYTRRNLWMLARYIPIQKLQAELLNVRRNAHMYEDDPCAPGLYPMDYVFAVTMFANPLFWMELSGLAQEDADKLRPIAALFKELASEIAQCSIRPIGDMPDGYSFTGFAAEKKDSSRGYLLLFRENGPQSWYKYDYYVSNARVLYASAPQMKIECGSEGILLRAPRKRSFILAEF